MTVQQRRILVFGATGQQGGAVASALLKAGWQTRTLVRDPSSSKATALRCSGAEVVKGDFAQADSIRAAMRGVHGVFSVQPSSGQGAIYGVTDEQEVHYGTIIADLAVEGGVSHLIYSSANAVGDGPTGMGHFDSKAQIEAHVRRLPIAATIVRPAAFMEMLMMPGFGLDQGRFNFLMKPDQPMQFLAVADLGEIVASVFADRARFSGATFELASDVVTGRDLEALFSAAAGRPITYARFPEAVLSGNPFLAKLADLVDRGRLVGRADLEALRSVHPGLRSFRSWLATEGRPAFEEALGTAGTWSYGSA